MNCKTTWDNDVVSDMFPKTFIANEYKMHIENVLINKELSMMPATQPYVSREIEVRKLREAMANLQDIKEEVERELEFTRISLDNILRTRVDKVPVNFTRACPVQDCKGFLNHDWSCGICSMWVCKACNAVCQPGQKHSHKCDPSDVATATLINTQSKPCPGCGYMISRIDGCDQMFCTQCKQTFSWTTGAFETRHFHNPHWLEWQRQVNNGVVPRAIGDQPCGGMPLIYDINAFVNKRKVPEDQQTLIYNIYRLLRHIEFVEIPQYVVRNNNRAGENEQMNKHMKERVSYMLNELTIDEFKKKVYQAFKSDQRKHTLHSIVEMFYNAGRDIMQNIISTEKTQNIASHLNEIKQLQSYVNDHLKKVSKVFQCTVPIISSDFSCINKTKF